MVRTARRVLCRLAARTMVASLGLLVFAASVRGDGPADNDPAKVRRVPRLGIELSDADRARLQAKVDQLKQRVASYRSGKDALQKHLLPDIEIFTRAVGEAITYQEFFAKGDIAAADRILEVGEQRMRQLENGQTPWTSDKGLVVRGFVSKLDGAVQPYGLVIPQEYSHQGPPSRLDVWFHGRGETLSELKFLDQRLRQTGVFTPRNGIVLHPYGRYSNAFKFAGEVDTLEAIDSVRARYRIDDNRTSVRGFSMGGAACWQFAVHYSDRWFAANPGAGFSETPEFLRFFQKEDLQPAWWEKKLWRWYDCTDWALNLRHCPTVAYSGEKDIQKQAADIMAEALQRHGIRLTHIIGPETGHRYEPGARDEVARRMASLAERGRRLIPRTVDFVTYTLKYNRMHWIRVDGLQRHWERAEVHASIVDRTAIQCRTQNVSELTLTMPSGWCPFDPRTPVRLEIDNQALELSGPESDRSWTATLHRNGDRWIAGPSPDGSLRKIPGLQGPIDDAFMDRFLFVEPTGKSRHALVQAWADSELERAKIHWRRHFRGHARTCKDVDLSDEDIATSNLVLWGDPNSNQVLKRIADQLPIAWKDGKIKAGNEDFDAEHHALILIYPNPLNPSRYVVLNSGFTFRDFAYLNNARQTPKLPDWAVVDLRVQPDSRWPGRIASANFFDEQWRLAPPIPVD